MVAGALLLTGCGEFTDLGSPVQVTNSPLAERIENRETEAVEVVLSEEAPEAIAFAEALASGNPILLNILTGPSGTGLFAGPGRGYEELTRLPSGADVLATGTQTGEWAYVVYGETEGWVNTLRLSLDDLPEQELDLTGRTIEETITVYGVRSGNSSVNIRSGPDVSNRRLVSAPRGSELIATGNTSRHWVEVTYNGTTGWASGNYIDPIGTRTITRTIDEPTATTAPPATAAPVRRSAPAPAPAPATTTTEAPADDDGEAPEGEGEPDAGGDGDGEQDDGNTEAPEPTDAPETTNAPETTAAPATTAAPTTTAAATADEPADPPPGD